MEKFPTLKRLSKKSAICFSVVFLIFFASAFYPFIADSSLNSSITFYNFLDHGEDFLAEAGSNLPQSTAVYKVVSNPDPSATPGEMTVEKRSSKTLTPASDGSKLLSKQENYHQHDTKHIYLVNSSSAINAKHETSHQPGTNLIHHVNSLSVTNASVVTNTTPMPSPDICRRSTEGSKLILLWTPFFNSYNYLLQSNFDRCKWCRNCKITKKRSKLLESDAVIFHCRDMSIADMPVVRLPHQRWIFYCLESPPYSDFPGLQYTQDMFNWTMSYRGDSDIQSPYGTFRKIRPLRKLDLQSLEWAWSNKSQSVAWMSSHCPTQGGRDDYVKELQKYIDVDIYGSCGTTICPLDKTEDCYQEFARHYKFFLAFENTICKDYITEKFFRTFKYNIIPVVFGGANYNNFAPPGSYIDALSFESPKHLASFLYSVGKNFKRYSSYFKWRKNYSVMLGNKKECQLCYILHNKVVNSSSYQNIRKWWFQESPCKVWKPK